MMGLSKSEKYARLTGDIAYGLFAGRGTGKYSLTADSEEWARLDQIRYKRFIKTYNELVKVYAPLVKGDSPTDLIYAIESKISLRGWFVGEVRDPMFELKRSYLNGIIAEPNGKNALIQKEKIMDGLGQWLAVYIATLYHALSCPLATAIVNRRLENERKKIIYFFNVVPKTLIADWGLNPAPLAKCVEESMAMYEAYLRSKKYLERLEKHKNKQFILEDRNQYLSLLEDIKKSCLG